MNRIYNEKDKEEFLSTYDNTDTQKTLRNVFYKTHLIEDVLEKDLSNFNLDQVGKCIANSVPLNSQTARSTGRFISSYLDWAIEKGMREGTNMNPLKGIDPSWYDQFIDKKKVHFSYDEFLELLKTLKNGQDQAFLFLQWYGISGKSFSQIRELLISDIKWDTNEVYVKERDMNIEVNEDCMRFLELATKQTNYYSYNDKTKEYNEKELLNSSFLFKNVQSPRTTLGISINPSVLYTRLSHIKEANELSYLTPNSLRQSGMIKMAADLYEEYGKLEYEQFAIIGEKYDYATVKAPSGEYYNTSLMKEFISEKNLKEFYNIDIKF